MIEIRQATTEADFRNVGHFYHAFAAWLKQTYPEIINLFEDFFIELEAEIVSLPGIYEPPTGSLLLATYDGIPAGTVGLADLGEDKCEMRRMFVDSTFRGHKIGFALGAAILDEARKRNYSSMRLSTGPRHYAALGLYQSLGFTVVDEEMSALNMPNGLPEDLAAGVIEMELKL